MNLRPESLLMLAARMRTAVPWYSRHHAESYEAKRQGAMWRAETEAFRPLYDRVKPATVLDAPVGTGRWFDIYQDQGACVLGVDLSPDMLDQAAKKIRPGCAGALRLQRANLLNPEPEALGRDHDLIVCTRFTHWLRTSDVAVLGRNFAVTGARHLIIGGRMKPETPASPKNGSANGHWRRRLKKAFSRKRLVTHIHVEAEFLSGLEVGGWRLAEKQLVRTTPEFRYYFYLLQAG